MASNVARNLNSHYSRLATSTQRLSSGLRINSSADDAAGLAIRELMRNDIAALNQGSKNANDAISLIQVADGALGIIDEKLIRMKELAEQAATGTYDSTQRLMIHSEFVAMAAEIDRIANATDFNGIKLLDGSLAGEHDGTQLNASGKMKVHFGTANDSAEDYYYVEIGDCTTKGLGLTKPAKKTKDFVADYHVRAVTTELTFNDLIEDKAEIVKMPSVGLPTFDEVFQNPGKWIIGKSNTESAEYNFMFLIPKGTKNIVINANGAQTKPTGLHGHNDLQLFTQDGVHLAGTPGTDYVYKEADLYRNIDTKIEHNCDKIGFTIDQYDPTKLNQGPSTYNGTSLNYTEYNGMKIGFSGDPDQHDANPNDGRSQTFADYELLTISEVTEDIVVWYPGNGSGFMKAWGEIPPDIFGPPLVTNQPFQIPINKGEHISIRTQGEAQQALERIDDAIITKDKIRATAFS